MYPVFSPKFRSAGKGPFIAGKVKNMHQRCTFLWGRRGEGGGEWSERHGLTLGGNTIPSFQDLFCAYQPLLDDNLKI